MATGAIHAQGTLLQRGDGLSPEGFTTIAEVGSISGPTMQADLIEVTNHSSVGRFREYIQGLKDGGELTFDLYYQPNEATHRKSTGVLGDWDTGVRRNYRLRFPVTPAVDWILPGVVTNFEIGAEVDSALTASVTLKVVSAPTLA